jgi:sugar-specific transcriptional regulator TrmB
MVRAPGRREAEKTQSAGTGPLDEVMCRELEELGLNPSEARVTLALLQSGSAKSTELARLANVPRTSIYQVIEALQDKNLVLRVPGDGPAMWTTPGRDRVLDRLHIALAAAQEERLHQHAVRTQRLRELMEQGLREGPAAALPYVHVLSCPAEVRSAHERLLADARFEVLVFNRPPYSAGTREVHAATMRALGRGVAMKVLYQAAQVEDPEAHDFRASVEAYREAGVMGRVVDELPTKLVVADREVVLLAIENPVQPHVGFPVTMLIEHPGFAALGRRPTMHLPGVRLEAPAPTKREV